MTRDEWQTKCAKAWEIYEAEGPSSELGKSALLTMRTLHSMSMDF